jgi:hypothetical protein
MTTMMRTLIRTNSTRSPPNGCEFTLLQVISKEFAVCELQCE